MHQKGCMWESGSESGVDGQSESSGSGSGSDSESGSSSSGSESGRQSGSAKSYDDQAHKSDEEAIQKSDNDETQESYNERSSPNKSSPRSNNQDDYKGSSEELSYSRNSAKSRSRKLSSDVWEENPDIYGIRRSARSRKEPERLKIDDSDSSDRVKNNRTNSRKKSDSWNSNSSESESDDGSPPPPSKRPGQRSIPLRKKKPARRRNKSMTDDEESTEASDEDSRRTVSRRKNANAVSYKEASDEQTDSSDLLEVEAEPEVEEEERCETIEKVLGMRRGKKGVTGSITTIYHIEDNGDPNEGCDPNDKESTELQYLIKWKGWAHIHNTWESEQSLQDQKVKGIKKLENFKKKEADLAYWRRSAGPEDIDYYECQQELQQDLVHTYNSVDRIIAEQTRETETGTAHEYLCKWESLPYSDATWEDSSLIERRWSDKVSSFRSREAARTTPSRHTPALRRRPKFQQLISQPAYMGADKGLTLRDYQLDGLNWLIASWCKNNSVILADEMGLGKTIQTICFLYYLFMEQSVHGTFLCIVPLSTMTAWQREFEQWAPNINVVTYLGDISSRDVIRQYEWSFSSSKRLKFNAILTTYEILLKDAVFLKSFSWGVLLVDEAHRLKNDDSLLYKALSEFHTNHRLLVTGTPLQNSLKELWALLHFIMPYKFETWEDFEKDHEDAATKGYEKLHKQLEPFILRRQKKDVEKSLPAKVEQILRVEMTSIQKQYYKWILTKNYSALRKGVKGSITTFINIVIELKKCCNHALLTRPTEYEETTSSSTSDAVQALLKGSGKLLLLDKLLVRLRETGHRVLIFSQMVRMLDIIAEYLQKRHFPFQRLDGSIKGDIRKQALDHFNAEGSQDFCFLLSTRAGGLGINLATADTVIIFDSDWNPQNDLQAQARAHRIGQKNQVNIYRLVTARSVEEDIVERAKRKMVLDHLVIQRMDTTGRTVLHQGGARTAAAANPFDKDDLNAILKFGAEELFKDDDDNDEEPQCDIDEILRRAETRDEPAALAGDELLSAFKVASFAFREDQPPAAPKEWEDIIPVDVRKNIEEEEKNKEMEDLYLPPRSRKTVNQNDDEKRGEKRSHGSDSETLSEGEDEEVDESAPKRRGRPPSRPHRDAVKGFTEREIRRFVKSYKKFSAPLHQLEAVIGDADLRDKPIEDVRKLATVLQSRCQQALANEGDKSDGAVPKKGRLSFKIGGVAVNARTLDACEKELAPLHEILPAATEQRLAWTLPFNTRSANFDVDWTVTEDSRLLVGIYQYGLGSWEAIKIDEKLGLGDKILPNAEGKPQAKHLQSRAEYLLKVAKKILDQKNGAKKTRKKRTKKTKEPVTKDVVEEEGSSHDENKQADKEKSSSKEKTPKQAKEDTLNAEKKNNTTALVKDKKEKKKKKKEKKVKKKQAGPMHFTANSEPRALEILGDLDPAVFQECKEKMRPVKKALRALDNPDTTLSEQEQFAGTRACIQAIGRQIDTCLLAYSEPEKKVEWRSYLWYFVSKFTVYDAKQLYRLYKHDLKREETLTTHKEKDNNHTNNDYTNHKGTNNHHNNDKNSHIVKKEKEREKEKEKEKEKERREDTSERDRKRDRERERERDRGDPRKRKFEDGDCEPENKRHSSGSRRRSRSRDRSSGGGGTRRRYESGGGGGGGGGGSWSHYPPHAARPHPSHAPHLPHAAHVPHPQRTHDKRARFGPMGYGNAPAAYGYYESANAFPRSGYDWRDYHQAPHHDYPPHPPQYRQRRPAHHNDL